MRIINILIYLLLLAPSLVYGQESGVEMADTFRSEGKIYVVVLVVAIVFTGLVIFAFRSERKISKLEKEIESLKSLKGQ